MSEEQQHKLDLTNPQHVDRMFYLCASGMYIGTNDPIDKDVINDMVEYYERMIQLVANGATIPQEDVRKRGIWKGKLYEGS